MTPLHEDLFDGLEAALKTCNKCLRSLPESCFSKASGGNYFRSECKECERELTRIRQQIKKSAPPPPAGHTCPICQRSSSEVLGEGGKKSGEWCCDHDHNTNQFRDWLCHSCNRALGNMNDDISMLKRAIEYLEKHNGTQASNRNA